MVIQRHFCPLLLVQLCESNLHFLESPLPKVGRVFIVKENLLLQQILNLVKFTKQILLISHRELGKGAMPTIDEELLNLIKIPQLRHRIELQNGTIVNGEIIQEDNLGIIVQTSKIGRASCRERV